MVCKYWNAGNFEIPADVFQYLPINTYDYEMDTIYTYNYKNVFFNSLKYDKNMKIIYIKIYKLISRTYDKLYTYIPYTCISIKKDNNN